MDYEQFKERIEEDLHQAFAAHGIDANLIQLHVEKLNASYDALIVTPEGSHIGVNANLSDMFEAIENGQDYNRECPEHLNLSSPVSRTLLKSMWRILPIMMR